MAEGSLAIQPMSVEGERLLSTPGKTASGLRTHLNAGIIAICQVLLSWRCAGLIKDLDPLPNSHLEKNAMQEVFRRFEESKSDEVTPGIEKTEDEKSTEEKPIEKKPSDNGERAITGKLDPKNVDNSNESVSA
ncbi:hypothetical protein BGZ61DRAFT_593884 [Ilyonectria robusta]|uniref:uncharacterized protein n=1 Tax=Ilyonectria robusta TaxID=1079257 RepID=UPI001E8CE45D|nr:uncharacterized protein BGZ61DRAFT_593884 [Ilyonectria robusta]KAH8659657.1 hypothetical protein BGZ61DRAFT_593884 [Ilyonectria robusta]